MTPAWSLADVTECSLRLRHGPEVDDAARAAAAAHPDHPLLGWLAAARERDPGPARAARIMVRAEFFIRLAWMIVSALLGMTASTALLRYEGDRLINVSAFLGVLVGGQLLLLVALAVSSLLVRRVPLLPFLSAVVPGLDDLLTGEGRTVPARFWRWRAFASLQWAAVAFNLGVLATTLVKVVVSDLAFGWATTLQLGEEGVHAITHALSRPWGGAWTPDLAQIAASRIVLKDGLSQVAGDAAAAWWPFLLLAVLVYGLLPRLVMALGCELRLWIALRRHYPRDPAAERLRLTLTRAPLSGPVPDALSDTFRTSATDTVVSPQGAVRLILPPHPAGHPSLSNLEQAVSSQLGVSVAQGEGDAPGGVVLLQEAWSPPLEETLEDLRNLRLHHGGERDLFVLLAGLPVNGGSGVFEPPSPQDVAVWRAALARLRDPRVWVLPWEVSA